MAVQLDDGGVLCEQCGGTYERVGGHWSKIETCNFPELDSVTKDIIVGMLMSDGSINGKKAGSQYFVVNMTTPLFLHWLDDELGWLSTGVKLVETAETRVEYNTGTDFTETINAKNYNDLYRLVTRSHPFMAHLSGWYDTGRKVMPKDIKITPTKLLMLYVGDGNYNDCGGQRYIRIAMINERDNKDKVYNYFSSSGIEPPSAWGKGNPSWTVSESYELFDYMAESPLWDGPPQGFEYKFPENFGGTGRDMSDLQ